jgi:hypothetical protein
MLKCTPLFLTLLLVGCAGSTHDDVQSPVGEVTMAPAAAPGTIVVDPDTGETGCPGTATDTGSFMLGPQILTTEQASRRWMATETDISKVKSSIENPIEVCGVPGQVMWLMNVTCPDGSHPHTDPEATHWSRIGSVGQGGRCGAIIDLYPVPCPDGDYEVYMDMYMCTQAEAAMAFSYL